MGRGVSYLGSGWLRAVALAMAVALALAAGVAAAGKPRADLKPTRVAPDAQSVAVGASVRVRLAMKNAGRKRARRSVTRFLLSRDRKRSRDDLRMGTSKLRALKPGKTSRRVLKLKIPAGTPPATGYRMLACADSKKKVRERNERNNCRASRRTLTVANVSSVGPPNKDPDRDGAVNAVDCAPKDPKIHPGAADEPDVPAFVDSNCDGIDGVEARAIFVSGVGDDEDPGTRARPKRTLQGAVGAAANAGKDVYASLGIYSETLQGRDGVGVYGGFGTTWGRSLSHVTRIDGGGSYAGAGALLRGITRRTTFQHLTFNPGDGRGFTGGAYGLMVGDSPGVVLDRIVARAGNGAAGRDGAPGAPGRRGDGGASGGQGSCDGFNGLGGGLTGSRGDGEGGEGGAGGGQSDSAPTNGQAGGGTTGGPAGTHGSNGDPGSTGGAGYAGDSGTRPADGSGGFGGRVLPGSTPSWLSQEGQFGSKGTDGGGGGGGGGGGAQVCFLCDNGGGNGGGEGGDGGTGGGGGGAGQGGGGSFGVLLLNSSGAVIRDSQISAGDGGKGGNGGGGGAAGAPGQGGPGGTTCLSEVGKGGNGGLGGPGGLGSHGGGGAGGPSFAIYTENSAITQTKNKLSHGSGGAGGVSSGNPGGAGAAGDTN